MLQGVDNEIQAPPTPTHTGSHIYNVLLWNSNGRVGEASDEEGRMMGADDDEDAWRA